jgi:hypothetical protein
MNKLDPKELFERIARDVPTELHQHLFVTGSLAAAYHYFRRSERRLCLITLRVLRALRG